MTHRGVSLVFVLLCLLPACGKRDERMFADGLVAPYVPTPPKVVDAMLELAHVTKDDVVYDLGCGDGRIVIAAAKKHGCRAVGVDLDPRRVQEALDNVRKEKLEHLITIRQQDIFDVDVSEATVVMAYLFEEAMLKLRPTLRRQLRPGSRIVSHGFKMGDWKPEHSIFVKDESDVAHKLFLWKIE